MPDTVYNNSVLCDAVHLTAATASCERNAAEPFQSGSGTASTRPNSGTDATLVPLRQEKTPRKT